MQHEFQKKEVNVFSNMILRIINGKIILVTLREMYHHWGPMWPWPSPMMIKNIFPNCPFKLENSKSSKTTRKIPTTFKRTPKSINGMSLFSLFRDSITYTGWSCRRNRLEIQDPQKIVAKDMENSVGLTTFIFHTTF